MSFWILKLKVNLNIQYILKCGTQIHLTKWGLVIYIIWVSVNNISVFSSIQSVEKYLKKCIKILKNSVCWKNLIFIILNFY